MQKTAIVIALLVCVGFAATVEFETLSPLWEAWKANHGKSYSAAEETARYAIFVENYKRVLKFNSENETPKLGLNNMADLTAEEFKNIYTGCYLGNHAEPSDAEVEDFANEKGALPTSVDWRTKNAVTPIKNQGDCGSCWTFSATGTLEGWNAIKNGTLLSFSEQQIVDCDAGGQGCDGGWPYQAVDYVAKNGVELESEYPYTGQDGKCQFNSADANHPNTGYKMVLKKSMTAMKLAITKVPVSVAIEADQDVFQLYTSGVITTGCGASLDHGVLVVGYDDDGSNEYYIVKNSWGTSWGNQGYVYISTDAKQNDGTGVCGILSQPVIPK